MFTEANEDGNEDCKTVLDYKINAQVILDKLARHQMKAVFIGRTSSGKSTVINAMLQQRILPSGIGHTTNCFLQLEGTDESEGFLTTSKSKVSKGIGSINQLASAISDSADKLEQNSLINIFWPKENFRLLKEEVVLIDSPGLDITPDLDDLIDSFCLDADVFVLVANAESTITQTEKNFFHKVSSRLSKPNIFILQNRWDASADVEDAIKVKKQHYARNIQFLTEELKVGDEQEAKNRIFFVSAKETLISRLHKDSETTIQNGLLQKNNAERLSDFTKFESAFELCISESAVHIKFQKHIERGKEIASALCNILDRTSTRCQVDLDNLRRRRQETAKGIANLKKKITSLTLDIKKKTKSAVEKVKEDVLKALSDEIGKLPNLVEEFKEPFSYLTNSSVNSYKEKLRRHVTEKLKCSLEQRFNIIQQDIVTAQNEMTDRCMDYIKGEEIHLTKRDFKLILNLDGENVCRKFQESVKPLSVIGYSIPGLAPALLNMPMLAAGSTSLILIYNFWDWYWSLEKIIKKQFVEFVSKKLMETKDTISVDCGQQAEQELSVTSVYLSDVYNRWDDRLNTQLQQTEEEIRRLDETAKQLKSLSVCRNKADELKKEFISFEDEFLKKS